MAKKTDEKTEGSPVLRIPLEQSFQGRAIEDHKKQATNAYLASAHDMKKLRAKGRNSQELSFILGRKGFAQESVSSLPEVFEALSEAETAVLRTKAPSQSVIDALPKVDSDVRSIAVARIASGAVLSGSDIFLLADELHRSSLRHDQQCTFDLRRHVTEQTSRLTAAGRHPFQQELTALFDLLKEYENEQHLLDSDFDELKAEGLTQAIRPISSLGKSGVRSAAKALDSFDDLFGRIEAPRSTWAHLELIDRNASLLAQARYALDQIAKGNLAALDRHWSEHFPRTGREALRYLLGAPPAKTINQNEMTRPPRILNAAVVGTGTFGVALGLEAAGYAIRAIFEDNDAARNNIRARRSDWKVQKRGVNGNDAALYKQLKRNRVGKDLHLLAGKLGLEAWDVRADTYDPYPNHVRIDELLAELSPTAFFFELPVKSVARDMMAFEIDRLGYESAEFNLSLTDFHVPQARTRTVFCGIKRSVGTRINPPVVKRKKVGFVSYTEEAIRVRGMSTAMKKWRTVNLKKKVVKEEVDDPRNGPVPDLETLRMGEDVGIMGAWNHLGLSSRDFSLRVAAPQTAENLLPLSMQLLKRLQGIPGKWALSGSVEVQLEQIIEAVPPIIARMMGHQIHSAQSGQYVNLDAAVAEEITLRNNEAGSARKNSSEFYELRKRADLYEREVLMQEQESELRRLTEEKAWRASISQPRKSPPPPPPGKWPNL